MKEVACGGTTDRLNLKKKKGEEDRGRKKATRRRASNYNAGQRKMGKTGDKGTRLGKEHDQGRGPKASKWPYWYLAKADKNISRK